MMHEGSERSASRRTRWVGRVLRHPVVLVLLLLFLFYEAVARGEPPGRTRSTAHGRPLPVAVYRTSAGIEIHFEPQPSESVPADLTRVWDVVLFDDIPRKHGAWWPTRETTALKLLQAGDLTAAEQSSLLPALVAAFGRQPDYEHWFRRSASLARAGIWSTSTPLYDGYVRNVVSIVALSWLLVGGFFAGRETIRQVRERDRRSRGECPACGFSLSGLAGRPCPECGHRSAAGGSPARLDDTMP